MGEKLLNFRPRGHKDKDHEKLIRIQGQLFLIYLAYAHPKVIYRLHYILAGLSDAPHFIDRALILPHLS